MFLFSLKLSGHLKQLGLKNYSDGMKIKFFDNRAKIYVTSSKIKGNFSNYQRQF